MRALNERLLLEHIRGAGRTSRAELARVTGLSKPTVALALANLEQDGLVKVAGLRTGLRGPAAVLYQIPARRRLCPGTGRGPRVPARGSC